MVEATEKPSHPAASHSSIHLTDKAIASSSTTSVNTVAMNLELDQNIRHKKIAHDNSPTQTSIGSYHDVAGSMSSKKRRLRSPYGAPSLSFSQETSIGTIEDTQSPSYDENAYLRDPDSDTKTPTSRTFSMPFGPPPSYDSFSTKLRLRPLKPVKTIKNETTWGIHWYMPSCMLLGILAGLLTGVGHHVYNSSLHNHEVGDPTWPQRFGSAFSFFIKFCLVGTVEIAYKQRAWMTVKKRDFQVKTLDGIFSACNDPYQFLNPELIFKATVSALLAGMVWSLPLCAVASPATLTSISRVVNYTTTCDSIQSIDFTRENGFAEDSITSSTSALSFYRWLDQTDEDGPLVYDEPSTELSRVSTLSLISKTGPIVLTNPCQSGGNCSYSFSFYGPSYSCEEVADFSKETSTMSLDAMVPNVNQTYIYFAESDEEENAYGAPTPSSPTNASQTIPWDGAFTKEASLYVGWVENTTQLLPPNDTPWAFLLIPHVMQCTMYNASYSYSINFLEGLMKIETQDVELISPLLEENTTTIGPDDPGYGAFSAYHAMGFIYRNMLKGAIDQYTDKGAPTTTNAMSSSLVSQTTLVNPHTQFAVPNFTHAVELGFQNMTFSLLSDEALHSHINITGPCTTTKQTLIWHYDPFWLVLSYSIGVFATIIAAAIGVHAFRSNGYSVDTNFSTFLATTRNGSLDQIVGGACLGQEPLEEAFKDVRLKFGDVGNREGCGPGHVAFGLPGETRGIVFGESYA